MKILIILLLIFLVSACSTYSKKECVEMDQTALGYKDGSLGVGSFEVSLNHYKDTCEKDHGIAPDVDKIKSGYESGKRFYCSAAGAEKVGSSGLSYTGICSKDEEKIFFEKFNSARMIFLDNKVNSLNAEVDSLKKRIRDLESDLLSCESRKRDVESKLSSCK